MSSPDDVDDGDFPPRTPARGAEDDEDKAQELSASPIQIESITRYNKPSDRVYENTRIGAKKSKSAPANQLTSANIHWKGINMQLACTQGNLPVVLTLWGLGLPKGIDMMAADDDGNTPVHYSALADNAEPLSFFLNEAQKISSTSYVHAVNAQGMTPLLLACTKGKINVIKALLDEKSDMFAKDNIGSTVFILLAKNGHIWAMHFLFSWIKDMHGEEKRKELFFARDLDGHGVMDWAAEYGDVNLIEYLVRRECDPTVLDSDGRSSLYWAVSNDHIRATAYLVQLGCSATQKDTAGQSPLSLAKNKKNALLIRSTLSPSSSIKEYVLKQAYPNLSNAFTLSFLVLFTWIVILVTPYYICIPLIVIIGYLYYKMVEDVTSRVDKIQVTRSGMLDPLSLSLWDNFFYAPEKYLSVYFGSFIALYLYLINCISDDKQRGYLGIGTSSIVATNPSLFWFNFYMLFICSAISIYFIFIDRNPGIVNTRKENFTSVIDAGVGSYGEPPSHIYCRTTLVQKPIRSKYCASSHVVIARFDHYCVWLCNAIGYRNHRLFLVLVALHLVFAVTMLTMICIALHQEVTLPLHNTALDALFSRQYFFPLMLSVALFALTVLLLILLCDQLYMVVVNVTTNERINGHRYYYMLDQRNNVINRFDRGVVANILEFLRIGSLNIDYYKMMTAPVVGQASKSAFTSELDDELTTETRSPMDHV